MRLARPSVCFLLVPFLSVCVACSTGDPLPDAPAPPPPLLDDPPQAPSWRGVFDEASGRPTLLLVDGPPGLDPAPAAALALAPERARRFLGEHPELFGAAAQDDALRLLSLASDPLRPGGARVRFAVSVGGLELDGGDVTVLLGPGGAVRAVAGLPGGGALSARPTLPAETAARTALAATSLDTSVALVVEDRPALVAVPGEPAARAAWRVTVTGEGLRRSVFVDAASGAIFHVRDGLQTVAAHGSGLDVRGVRRQLLLVKPPAGRYLLEDGVHGARTLAGLGAQAPLASADPDRWDEGVVGAGAAVDAHANGGEVLAYLASAFGRRGVDGSARRVDLVVHAGERLVNAYWDGRRAVFGDGDGRTVPLSGGLDVVAHELFHGVTQAESGLIYAAESGALNESLSDVFACLVELERDGGNWSIGETVAPEPLRDLADPHRSNLPAHLREYVRLLPMPEEDMGGVHVNSTIPSHAAYLVAEGGPGPLGDVVVEGLGRRALRDVWWRAATLYLGPRARFSDFAGATLAAAEDLYGPGSPQAASVASAWQAVGVRVPVRP